MHVHIGVLSMATEMKISDKPQSERMQRIRCLMNNRSGFAIATPWMKVGKETINSNGKEPHRVWERWDSIQFWYGAQWLYAQVNHSRFRTDNTGAYVRVEENNEKSMCIVLSTQYIFSNQTDRFIVFFVAKCEKEKERTRHTHSTVVCCWSRRHWRPSSSLCYRIRCVYIIHAVLHIRGSHTAERAHAYAYHQLAKTI